MEESETGCARLDARCNRADSMYSMRGINASSSRPGSHVLVECAGEKHVQAVGGSFGRLCCCSMVAER